MVDWIRNSEGHDRADVDGLSFRVIGARYGRNDNFRLEILRSDGWDLMGRHPSSVEAKEDASAYAFHMVELARLKRTDDLGMTGKHSPWGSIEHATRYGEGTWFVGTSGHGGLKLDPARNQAMPDALRLAGGCYEQDIEWSRVAVANPSMFTAREVREATRTMRNWHPEAWEAFSGTVLQPGESHVKDRRAFMAAHEHDLLGVSAIVIAHHVGRACACVWDGWGRADGAPV